MNKERINSLITVFMNKDKTEIKTFIADEEYVFALTSANVQDLLSTKAETVVDVDAYHWLKMSREQSMLFMETDLINKVSLTEGSSARLLSSMEASLFKGDPKARCNITAVGTLKP